MKTARDHLAAGLLSYGEGEGLSPNRKTMSPAHQLALIDQYPVLYRLATEPQVPACRPFSRECFACGDGWFQIVDLLSAKLATDPNLVVDQLKEKFGRLTVYLNADSSPELVAAMSDARDQSLRTCETCGAAAELKQSASGWRSVRCDSCDWLVDMEQACDHLVEIVGHKTREEFIADFGAVAVAKYHVKKHLGLGAGRQPAEVRKHFPAIDWPKLDLWAKIDSPDKMEETVARHRGRRFTTAELESMVFRVTPDQLWKFIDEDVPAIKAALW